MAAMLTRNRQSSDSRQAEIVATMVRLSAARSPSEITTVDIAHEMNVTQGALFRHFPSKEAIRLAVVEWIATTLLAELQSARAAAPDALQALRKMFMAHVRFAMTYPGAPRLIFGELQQPEDSPVRQGVLAIMRRYRQMLAETFAVAVAAKLIRDDLDLQAAAGLFLGAVQGLVIQSMLQHSPAGMEVQAAGVLELYLAGLERAS